ncbi:hypothetical protein EDB83DRAFT_2315056 [Lactarius deliciosus]|nr:hypothetical protein EDB83DRAFT_2315056 [Lactarius deliciosus]
MPHSHCTEPSLCEFIGGGDPAGVTEEERKAESEAFTTVTTSVNANGLRQERRGNVTITRIVRRAFGFCSKGLFLRAAQEGRRLQSKGLFLRAAQEGRRLQSKGLFLRAAQEGRRLQSKGLFLKTAREGQPGRVAYLSEERWA